MAGYDDWKTTPPDERGYCPFCYASTEDADRVLDDDEPAWRCCDCGRIFDDPIGHDEMVREGREEARLHDAGL